MGSGTCKVCSRTILDSANFEPCAVCGAAICEKCVESDACFLSPVDGRPYCGKCVEDPAEAIAQAVEARVFDRAREWERQNSANDMSEWDIRSLEDELSLVRNG